MNTGMALGGVERSAPAGNNIIGLWRERPDAEPVTAYDRRHAYLYGDLLAAEAMGIAPRQMARIFFQADRDGNASRASAALRWHLARAHWLKENVFAVLDW